MFMCFKIKFLELEKKQEEERQLVIQIFQQNLQKNR